MTKFNVEKSQVRLHLTNVKGLGATQLLQSLLPVLEKSTIADISEIYLPNQGQLSAYIPTTPYLNPIRYKRLLPNILSRLLECLILGYKFRASSPLLVLGDVPIAYVNNQVVFVQTPHLLRPAKVTYNLSYLKYAILRVIFNTNIKYVKAFIVQTVVMKEGLVASYPQLANKVFVIPQPVPIWLLESQLVRVGRQDGAAADKLSLVYPAATYPHKNHHILSKIISNEINNFPVEQLILTISPSLNPAPLVPWINCIGFQSPSAMINIYRKIDALLFLSLEESFGFPLVEAMFIGLPIICPNLPYARTLCGEQAVYFDPNSLSSLNNAIKIMHKKLRDGWWPDWTEQMSFIPRSWESVADDMLTLSMASSSE
jgi:glycosyltransferase involved in cell wall biosynthesis